MAAVPQAPPAPVEIPFTDLQKKVKETGGPQSATKGVVDEWLRFLEAPAPRFELQEGDSG